MYDFNVTYTGNHFEVRAHDAPTKYVWNSDTRVAHVIGSLSNNIRVQRLRAYPGWNLLSMAVGGSPLPIPSSEGQGEGVLRAAFKWFPGASNWLSVSTNETLPANTILWLN